MAACDGIGRSFEYCVTAAIIAELEAQYPGKVETTTRSKEAQSNGMKQFTALKSEQRKAFEKSASAIAAWLRENRFDPETVKKMQFKKKKESLQMFLKTAVTSKEEAKVTIDRIPDAAGVIGDVTDIRITFWIEDRYSNLNISLKHRHEALKHARLTRVPSWIGMQKTTQAIQYKDKYEAVWADFFEKGKLIDPNAERFRELKSIDPTFIEKNLYSPLYGLVKDFITENITDSSQVKELFHFLVGTCDFIKFIDFGDKIEVRDFSKIGDPKSVETEYDGTGYLYFIFDNGWHISGRLHTATQWHKKSIKFDLQLVNLEEVVPAESIFTSNSYHF